MMQITKSNCKNQPLLKKKYLKLWTGYGSKKTSEHVGRNYFIAQNVFTLLTEQTFLDTAVLAKLTHMLSASSWVKIFESFRP